MHEDNRTVPAVREGTTSDDITSILTQVDHSILSSERENDELKHTAHVMKRKETQPRPESHVEDIVAAYDNQHFKLNFRISRSTFEYILGIIGPELVKTAYTPPNKQLLITLSFMTTSDFIRSISHRFSVCEATAISCMRRVLIALRNLGPNIITWPSGNVIDIWKGFKDISGFPKVIGVLGIIHINLWDFYSHSDMFLNDHTGRWCIQLQVVCDHNARFIYCLAGCPGSMPRQRILELSKLQKWLGESEMFSADCYILGDAAYKLQKNIIVPYHDDGHLTSKQRNFNICHSATRIALKKAFSLLTTRFPIIKDGVKMKKNDVISNFAIACCVIHNICLSEKDEIDCALIDEVAENIPLHQDTALSKQIPDERDSICEMLPMRISYT